MASYEITKINGPLVSILIPAHNAQPWIADAIRSALAQTYGPVEVIVVDDGSADGTLSVAKTFESETVRVVSQKQAGASAARNRAFSLSKGEYIQWLDADDHLAPDKIAHQVCAAQKCGSKWTLFSSPFGTFWSRYYRAKFTPTDLWEDLSPADWLRKKMSGNLYMQTGTWLISRELSESAGPWDTRLTADDDGEYICRVLLRADSVRFVPDARAYYRLHSHNSLSYHGPSSRKLDGQWVAIRLHISHLRALEDSENTRVACVRYLQTWMPLFYPERLDIFNEAQEIARGLGGEIRIPTLPPKYAWIAKTLGWRTAKRARFLLPSIRWASVGCLDKVLYHFDRVFSQK
jgi:glycosyltransferase involved in cell wall biosynthesis